MARTTAGLAVIKARGVALYAARVAATGEAEVRRQMVEDGQNPDAAPPVAAGALAGTIRRRLGMTQLQFAEAIGVPVATLRILDGAGVGAVGRRG
jgi:putative transcriptional regulator